MYYTIGVSHHPHIESVPTLKYILYMHNFNGGSHDFFRYGFCVPYVTSHMDFRNGGPCDSVYKNTVSYIYIEKNRTSYYSTLFSAIDDAEHIVEGATTGDCTYLIIQMLCHYYLPPCGNETHYATPTSVCSDTCSQIVEKCHNEWILFQKRINQYSIPFMN